MKTYLPFGDWSDDGHGKYDKLLIDAPSMSSLLEAQKKLKEKYGDKMFGRHFASFYEEPNVGEEIWQALQDTGWTPADVLNYDSYFEFDDLSLEEYREWKENISAYASYNLCSYGCLMRMELELFVLI